jgi:REP element-mobilizing transposase RayT
MPYDRVWFLTWHTYGTWLPGNEKGFVSSLRNADGDSEIHNIPGTTIDSDSPHLLEWSRQQLKSKPLVLKPLQANSLAEQLLETTAIRGWTMFAFAIVTNHVHVVVGVPGDPKPESLSGDFKRNGSRTLNRLYTRPAGGTWWTESGSHRKLAHELAILGAIRYTIQQQGALVIWTASIPELNLVGGYLHGGPSTD